MQKCLIITLKTCIERYLFLRQGWVEQIMIMVYLSFWRKGNLTIHISYRPILHWCLGIWIGLPSYQESKCHGIGFMNKKIIEYGNRGTKILIFHFFNPTEDLRYFRFFYYVTDIETTSCYHKLIRFGSEHLKALRVWPCVSEFLGVSIELQNIIVLCWQTVLIILWRICLIFGSVFLSQLKQSIKKEIVSLCT